MIPILRFDDVVIDVDGLRATKAGVELDLEPKSFRVLALLARNADRVVKKEEIFEEVWSGTFVTDNALTRVIAQLRKALGDDAKQSRYIETVPTVGYRFIAGVIVEKASANPPPLPAPPPPAPEPVSWLRRMLVPVGALVAIGIGYFHQGPGEKIPLPVLRSIQVTSAGGLDSHPTFSPDGSSIAYASDRSGSFEIYLKLAGSEGRDVQITNDGRQNIEPSWAPDGKMIAYHSAKDRGIFVVSALGGAPRKLTDFGSQPSWAGESRRIVFRSAPTISMAQPEIAPTTPSTLWITTYTGGVPQQLTRPNQPPGRHSEPVFSPDGKRVLFVSHNRPGAALWEIELASGKLTRLETGLPYCYSPRFASGGNGIFFFGANSEAIGLYAMGIDKDTHAIVRPPERVMQFDHVTPRDLEVGPESRRLVYAVTTTSSNLWQWTESGGERPLTTETTNRITLPVFSPDGNKLAYVVRRKGAMADIWVSDADGSNASQITSNPGQDYMPSWSPDGRTIVYGSYREGKTGLWQYSLDSAGDKKIFEFTDLKAMARLSPNGREIVYHRGAGDELNVWIAELGSGKETQVTRDAESAGYPSWSPDGKEIALELRRGVDTHVAVVSAKGGEIRLITNRPGQAWPWGWSPDGKEITIAGHWNGVWNVYTVEAGSGAIRPITRNSMVRVFLRYPSLSPRGALKGSARERVMVYEKNETKGNVFLAEPAPNVVK